VKYKKAEPFNAYLNSGTAKQPYTTTSKEESTPIMRELSTACSCSIEVLAVQKDMLEEVVFLLVCQVS